MKFLLSIFFIVLCGKSFCQQTTIIVQDANSKPIPFVYVVHEAKRIYLSTNDLGITIIPFGNYNLQLTHVSYQRQVINLSERTVDTTIFVVLKKSEKILDDVILKTKQYKNGKTKTAGVYNLNSGSALILYSALNVGLICPAVRDINKHNVLTQIKFRSQKTSVEASKSLTLEIKIYGIEGDSLSTNPINRIPIYLKASELNGNVKIDLKERIVIPNGGVFLSFEIPPLEKIPVRVLAFTGSFKSETNFAYIRANKGLSWNVAPFKNYAHRNPIEPDKSFQPNLKIKYMEYEK